MRLEFSKSNSEFRDPKHFSVNHKPIWDRLLIVSMSAGNCTTSCSLLQQHRFFTRCSLLQRFYELLVTTASDFFETFDYFKKNVPEYRSRAQLCIRYCSNKHTHRSLSHFPSPPPPSFTQSPSAPRSLVRDEQTSPHRPRLVVSRSTCPQISPPSPRKQLCTRSCSNKHTHTPLVAIGNLLSLLR
jgi:hypothetical protein